MHVDYTQNLTCIIQLTCHWLWNTYFGNNDPTLHMLLLTKFNVTMNYVSKLTYSLFPDHIRNQHTLFRCQHLFNKTLRLVGGPMTSWSHTISFNEVVHIQCHLYFMLNFHKKWNFTHILGVVIRMIIINQSWINCKLIWIAHVCSSTIFYIPYFFHNWYIKICSCISDNFETRTLQTSIQLRCMQTIAINISHGNYQILCKTLQHMTVCINLYTY